MFIRTLIYMFLSEMGDKTQLLMIALTSKYKKREIIIGVFAAALVLNALSVLLGSYIGSMVPVYIVKLVSAGMFLTFAYMTLVGNGEEEKERKENDLRGTAAVFLSFFIAELGDKTQMSAIAFGADAGYGQTTPVIAACTLGLFLSDMVGFTVGYLLKAKINEKAVGVLSFSVFSVFGLLSLRQALYASDALRIHAAYLFPLCIAAYAALCMITCLILKIRKKYKVKRIAQLLTGDLK